MVSMNRTALEAGATWVKPYNCTQYKTEQNHFPVPWKWSTSACSTQYLSSGERCYLLLPRQFQDCLVITVPSSLALLFKEQLCPGVYLISVSPKIEVGKPFFQRDIFLTKKMLTIWFSS